MAVSYYSSTGEARMVLTPRNYPPAAGNGRPPLLVCHALSAPASRPADDPADPQSVLSETLADDGWPVCFADLAGSGTWGNNASIAAVGTAVSFMRSQFGATADPVVLVGVSMGMLAACGWARQNPSDVAGIAGVLGAVDLNDIHANDRGSQQASIDGAYGGTYVNATEQALHNPAYGAAIGDFDGFPISHWYASDDDIVVPSTVTTLVGDVADGTAVSLGALGHTNAAITAAIDGVVAWSAELAP